MAPSKQPKKTPNPEPKTDILYFKRYSSAAYEMWVSQEGVPPRTVPIQPDDSERILYEASRALCANIGMKEQITRINSIICALTYIAESARQVVVSVDSGNLKDYSQLMLSTEMEHVVGYIDSLLRKFNNPRENDPLATPIARLWSYLDRHAPELGQKRPKGHSHSELFCAKLDKIIAPAEVPDDNQQNQRLKEFRDLCNEVYMEARHFIRRFNESASIEKSQPAKLPASSHFTSCLQQHTAEMKKFLDRETDSRDSKR